MQEPTPEQPDPDHPLNDDPEAGVAVRVTWVPIFALMEHVPPQLMPGGLDTIVPLPAPFGLKLTLSVPWTLNREEISEELKTRLYILTSDRLPANAPHAM